MKACRSHIHIVAVVAALAFAACKGVPSYVIQPDDMASLLADVHMAEAVVDLRSHEFYTDSARMALKQSVFIAHGVTSEKFDTSLIWYGQNIGKYIEVYDKTIAILEDRSAHAGSMAAREAITMAGDSVDVWPASRYAYINDRLPSKMLTFDIANDENWECGDRYTWRIKLIGTYNPTVKWGIVADYADSTRDVLSMTTNGDGWNQAIFALDSAKTLTRLRGYALPADETRTSSMWVDSIELVRKRLLPRTYGMERSRIKRY